MPSRRSKCSACSFLDPPHTHTHTSEMCKADNYEINVSQTTPDNPRKPTPKWQRVIYTTKTHRNGRPDPLANGIAMDRLSGSLFKMSQIPRSSPLLHAAKRMPLLALAEKSRTGLGGQNVSGMGIQAQLRRGTV